MPDNYNYRIATATKSIDLPQWPSNTWQWYGGKPLDPNDSLVSTVAWLYRAIEMISQCASDVPFAIVKGETDIDTSDDWQNNIGFVPNPKLLIRQTTAALLRYGQAYHLRVRINDNPKTVKVLKYLAPQSITWELLPVVERDTASYPFKFTRAVEGQVLHYEPVKDIIYFWLPDPSIEIGPPAAWPAASALASANVLHSVDVFAAGFFENGAIKATIMPVPPSMPTGEQERLQKKLRGLITNVRNAFRLVVLGIGEGGKPVVVGEGLEALKDAGAISRAREDITAGFGISLAMILSDQANYATAIEDKKTLYSNTVLPMCNFIAEVWNEQVFKPMGYSFQFRPEGMEMFQEDENQRATSLGSLVASMTDPELFLIAADILGYDLTDEQIKMIEDLIAKKEQAAEQMQEQLASQPEGEPEAEKEEEPDKEDEEQAEEFAKWKRKALNAMKRGKSADVDFLSDVIPAERMSAIKAQLAQAKTEDDVKAAFVFTATDAPPRDVLAVVDAIRLGVEALKSPPVGHEFYGNQWTDGSGGSGDSDGINARISAIDRDVLGDAKIEAINLGISRSAQLMPTDFNN